MTDSESKSRMIASGAEKSFIVVLAGEEFPGRIPTIEMRIPLTVVERSATGWQLA